MDKYEKIKKIGRGTYGDVWLVKRKEDGLMVALKKVVLEQSNSSESSEGRGSRSSFKGDIKNESSSTPDTLDPQ